MHGSGDLRLGDFSTDRRVLLLSLMAVLIGISCAFVAYLLVMLIALMTNLSFYGVFSTQFVSPSAHHLGPFVILLPACGGLIIGLMARYGSERIRGHGIPEALEAILIGQSRMDAKVAVLKPISSAISIGTGGPFGAEGPIIMTGGAFGSLFAQLFHLSSAERKTLLVAGAAGGMAAIFAAPVAAVLLAVELLLFEWKPRSFVPVSIAAVIAGALRVPLMGAGPIFPVAPHALLGLSILPAAALVGLVCGLGSGLLTTTVYACEDLFRRLPIHWMWWPALGGLVVGIGGWIDPRVLGVGYDTIHMLLRGEGIGLAVAGLLIGKALVWSIALGSGTSGGVLAPLLIIGGALGVLLSQWIPAGDPALWGMVGMASIMGGTMRSPLTAMVFTLELTHDITTLPALLVGTIAAHTLTVLLLPRSILTEKVARRGHHVAREYSVDPLERFRVGEVMDRRPCTVPGSMTLSELADRITRRDPEYTRHQGFPVVDPATGSLIGLVTRGDLLRAMDQAPAMAHTIAEACSRPPIVAYPDEPMSSAVARLLQHDIGRLPVVERGHPDRLVGYLGRAAVLEARRRMLDEEHLREPGWLHPPHMPFLGKRKRTP